MILSPADLVPLLCRDCRSALEGGDEAAVFLCTACGLAHEPADGALAGFRPLSAGITSELAVGGEVRYLAVWRLAIELAAGGDCALTRLVKAKAPASVYLYVPAFTLARAVVQRLGIRLVLAQPELELTPGLAKDAARRPPLVQVGGPAGGAESGPDPRAPGFGTFSPIVVGRDEGRVLAHFVFLAVESWETPSRRSMDYKLETRGEELLYLPAVWDPRYVHDSNWRLLLREFDGQVA